MKINWKHVFGMGVTTVFLAAGIGGPAVCALAADVQPATRSSNTTGIAGEIVETESGIYYTVKPGDTLWGLSRKFADSPYLWPDLWSGNDQIANPHRIYPGQRIQLYRRADVARTRQAPGLSIDAAQPTPALLPPESPELGQFAFSRMDRVGFIRDPAVAPSGRIFKVLGIHKMITADDTVYISRENDQVLSPGQQYTIYRPLGEVRNLVTDQYLGVQHYILGTVEITQLEPEYAVGRVIKAFGRIQKDDLLMPYERRPDKIAKILPPPGIDGEVIMAEEHNQLLGDNVIAFINRGEKDGVKTGQVFDIYFQEEAAINPRPAEKTVLKPVVFGQLVVLRAEDTTATVYITQAKNVINPGARFSSPAL
ncbi:MAG: LysM domain-containing protein [Desulfobacterales bacterium]